VPKAARFLVLALLAAAAIVVPGAVRAEETVLTGTVGSQTQPNAFVIDLRDASGAKVSHLDPGTYTIVVHDYATEHNFHLFGPGSVSQSTEVDGTGTTTWTVTLTNGTYHYQCDPHNTIMHGDFTVGTVAQTPPPAKVGKLAGRIGPGRSISLRSGSGAKVKTLATGKWRVTVTDASRTDNFHLVGPGVNRRTGVGARGKVAWTVGLSKGKYRYFSDRHRRLGGTFTVVSKTTA
jgi:plastocyanin